MPTFRVKNTFEITTDRKLFVMAGSIVEGVIRSGMFVHVPLNSAIDVTARIHSIEYARRKDGEDVCLCIESSPELAEMLPAFNIDGETLEVTANGVD